jgi:hypothetical protein
MDRRMGSEKENRLLRFIYILFYFILFFGVKDLAQAFCTLGKCCANAKAAFKVIILSSAPEELE